MKKKLSDRWQRTIAACFMLTSCTRDGPADRQRHSAESADHASPVRPDSSPDVAESAFSTNQVATLFPTTFAEWRAAAPRLDSSSGTKLGRADFATPWLVIGDSIAVGFDRGIRGVLITDLRTGAQERFGREGRGPLEFSVQAMIGRWAGDSVLVIDRGQLRATVVNVHTRAGRSFQFIERDTSSMGEPLGSLADQRIVFRSRAPNLERGTDGTYRGLQVLRLKASTSDDATMRASVVGEAGIRVPFGGGRIIGNAPVQLAPLVAVGDKEVWWIPGGTDSLYAMGRTPPRFVGRVALPVKHFSRLEKSQLLTEHLSKFQKTPDVASAVAKFLTIPDSISSIGGLLAGEHGSLWFRITEPGVRDVGSVFVEAGPDALIARCFFVSSGRRVLAIGESVAIVATRDSSDDTYGISVVKLSEGCPLRGVTLWNRDARS